jgi:hypothetical protein
MLEPLVVCSGPLKGRIKAIVSYQRIRLRIIALIWSLFLRKMEKMDNKTIQVGRVEHLAKTSKTAQGALLLSLRTLIGN